MGSRLWFGLVGRVGRFRWVPQPPPPVAVRRVGHFEEMRLENGGAKVGRSSAFHREFVFNFPVMPSDQAGGIEVFADYAAGLHGEGLVYFSDEFYWTENLFAPSWAAPGLCELDWPAPVVGDVTFADVATNSYEQPLRKATFVIETASNATPLTDESIPFAVIPIPPDMKLHLGASGAASGSAALRVEAWANGAASAGATSSLTLLPETGATRMNAIVDGATYAFAKVYATRTSAAMSTLTLTSMIARLYPSTESPDLTGEHTSGRGHTGLAFADDAAEENYVGLSAGVRHRGLSTRLLEVGAWH